MDEKKLQGQAEAAVELSDELLDGAAGGQYVAQEMEMGLGGQTQDAQAGTGEAKDKSMKARSAKAKIF